MSRHRAHWMWLLLLALVPGRAGATGYPIFSGDPIDTGTGRAYTVLPGLPLLLEPNHTDDPPIVDTNTTGDVDLVVRAGTPFIGPTMPPPSTTPPTAVAGGTHLTSGTSIPFRVIAASGGTPANIGAPLVGNELDGLPVVVFAFADLDGDGFVGPTNADPDGATDNGREWEEAAFSVGRQVALFLNGVATGSVSVARGAPASIGGIAVVLTAAAYIGPFDVPPFLNIPDGPPVATLLPFFPRLDPDRVVEGDGGGGRARSDERVDFQLEPAFLQPIDDPTLGTPFALPTNGSSPTIDRAIVFSAPLARGRFVRPLPPGELPNAVPEVPTRIAVGPGGLFTPLTTLDVVDDGPGNTATVRLVPVDRLDNIADPSGVTSVELRAASGLSIIAPDTDADTSREVVNLATAAGVAITIGDAGGPNDGGAGASLAVTMDGYVVDRLAVQFLPAGATTTTTPTTTTAIGSTSTSATSSTTTTLPPCDVAATLDSITCRATALIAAIDASVPAGHLHTDLLERAARVTEALTAANDANAVSNVKALRTALRRLRPRLGRLNARLRSRAVTRLIGLALRDQLSAGFPPLRADILALVRTL